MFKKKTKSNNYLCIINLIITLLFEVINYLNNFYK